MPAKNKSLHGFVPDRSNTVLLLVDAINDFEFDGGDELARIALPVAHRIARLKRAMKERGHAVIYANDNFGKWQSDFRSLVEHCLQDGVRGGEIVRTLRPDDDDYFVLKPKHSAFFSTTLDTLLSYLEAEHLVLAGLVSNMCVLFSANDAYMRDYHLSIPADGTAAREDEDHRYAVHHFRKVLKADVRPVEELIATLANRRESA